MMRKIITALLFTCLIAAQGFSQAKKPTIMVMPSTAWCNQKGYMTEFDNQGVMEKVPDYNMALQNDTDLLLAISKLGEMMAEREFPLKDLEATMRSIRNESIEESLLTSEDGDAVGESPYEKILRTAKADIIMQLTYTINQTGPKKSLTFNLQGIDAYTNKQIAAASGTGEPTNNIETPLLLQAAILDYIEGFNDQLIKHFDAMFSMGREVSLDCRRFAGSDITFETEFDGEELGFIIEDWLDQNTVDGRFSTQEASTNRMTFEQVRIPLENARGRALDTRTWANDLRRFLSSNYGIDAKLSVKGLGQAVLTIGSK